MIFLLLFPFLNPLYIFKPMPYNLFMPSFSVFCHYKLITVIISHYLFLCDVGVAVERSAFPLHSIRNGRERTSVLQLN